MPTIDELRVRSAEIEAKEARRKMNRAERALQSEYLSHATPEVGYCDVCGEECPHCEAMADDVEAPFLWAESEGTKSAKRHLEEYDRARADLDKANKLVGDPT